MDQTWRGSAALQRGPSAGTLNSALPESGLAVDREHLLMLSLTHRAGSHETVVKKALCT